jgi:hypothetical protein
VQVSRILCVRKKIQWKALKKGDMNAIKPLCTFSCFYDEYIIDRLAISQYDTIENKSDYEKE